jgi:hypothetical protein
MGVNSSQEARPSSEDREENCHRNERRGGRAPWSMGLDVTDGAVFLVAESSPESALVRNTRLRVRASGRWDQPKRLPDAGSSPKCLVDSSFDSVSCSVCPVHRPWAGWATLGHVLLRADSRGDLSRHGRDDVQRSGSPEAEHEASVCAQQSRDFAVVSLVSRPSMDGPWSDHLGTRVGSLYVVVISLWLGYSLRKSGSLWTCIIIHSANNLLLTVL